jgi:putative transposase
VRELCRILGVNRGWFYRAGARTPAAADMALRDAIEALVLAFPGYGYRRVTRALQRDGWVVNHKRVLRVMRAESLLCQLRRRWVPTTDSGHGLATYPNLVRDRVVAGLNEVWVADITYVRLPTAFAYLAAVLDAFSRKVVGWALSRWIDTGLTLRALERALATRPPPLIHHADQGVQYAAAAYVARLQAAGVRISMAATGNPYQNARAEAFFKTLKTEEVYLKEYRTFAEAEANLTRFIEDVYNTKRLHSALGYRPPAEFEALVAPAAR